MFDCGILGPKYDQHELENSKTNSERLGRRMSSQYRLLLDSFALTALYIHKGLFATFLSDFKSSMARNGRTMMKRHESGTARIVSSNRSVKSDPPRQSLAQGPKLASMADVQITEAF
jgi:hypothetical protein